MYKCLIGHVPFQAENIEELGSLIVNVTFTLKIPEHLSEEARDLLRKLLVKDPSDRLSADEIIRHPWVSRHAME
jgi:serine/threonine protein kinase